MKRLLFLALLLGSLSLSAATLRCDRDLVSSGDHTSEVLDKCGQPNSRETIGYRRRGDDWGNYEEVRVEEWVYGPRNGMYYFLRFEGNRLIEIDSDRGR